MRGGLPLSYRGPGGDPPGKIWEIVVPEKRFVKPVLGQNVRFQTESQFDILNAIFCFNFSLYWCCSWHTMKKKGNDQDLTKYLINDCSSFWIMRVSLWSTNCVVPCAECTLTPAPLQKKCTLPHPPHPPPPAKKGHRVACASAETVQCLHSQNS